MRGQKGMNTELKDAQLFPGRGSGRVVLDEFGGGTPWAKGLWVVAVLIGLLDVYRFHKGAVFGYDTQHVWQAAHAILHGRSSWNQFVYPPGCLLFAFPFAVLPFRLARLLMYGVQCSWASSTCSGR